MTRPHVVARPRPPASAKPGSGLVAVTADEAGRFTTFAASMQGLWMPPGTDTLWQIGNDTPGNRNAACQQFLDGGHDWLWFLDDDHHFSHDLLYRLLDRQVPIVAPLVLRRTQPFLPVACLLDGRHAELPLLPRDEMIEVLHTGSAEMLIRRPVLEALPPPWFTLGWERDGKGEPQTVSEDVSFCRRARSEAGFDIYVDTACPMGHITTAVVWPTWHDGWMTGLTVANGALVKIPPGRTQDDDSPQ